MRISESTLIYLLDSTFYIWFGVWSIRGCRLGYTYVVLIPYHYVFCYVWRHTMSNIAVGFDTLDRCFPVESTDDRRGVIVSLADRRD